MTPRIIAVDWSGRRQGAGRTIFLAEARDGALVRLESGRDRAQVAEHVIAEAERDREKAAASATGETRKATPAKHKFVRSLSEYEAQLSLFVN